MVVVGAWVVVVVWFCSVVCGLVRDGVIVLVLILCVCGVHVVDLFCIFGEVGLFSLSVEVVDGVKRSLIRLSAVSCVVFLMLVDVWSLLF